MSARLSPHGESGLKSQEQVRPGRGKGLSPHGESGLKSEDREKHLDIVESLPAWGEWIEIVLEGYCN